MKKKILMEKEKMSHTKPWFKTQVLIFKPPKIKGERVDVEEGSSSAASGCIIRSKFTEKDEIIMLQCMIDYAKSKNLTLPLTNLKDFYSCLEGKLSAPFTNSQIYDKIRRFKEKYLKRSNKESGGAVLTFSSDHDFQVHTISFNIWGMPKDMDKDSDDGDRQGFSSKYPLLVEALEWENSSSTFSRFDTVKENMHLIGNVKANEMEMEWMELKSLESEIHSRKVNFQMALIRTVMNAMKVEAQ